MKKSVNTLFVVLSLIFGLSVTGIAQQVKPSEIAYQDWKEKRLTVSTADLSSGHLGIGFAASRYQQIGMTIDISIFVGKDVTQLPPLDFIVQPLAIEKDAKGSTKLVDVGDSATIKAGRLTTLTPTSSGRVAQPEIIARVPSNAGAVRIVVKGFGNSDQDFTVVLPLKDEPSTAVLAKAASCNAGNLSECQWFIGTCGSGC